MDKKVFKTTFVNLLKADVTGVATDKKLKYMKKWINEYEKVLNAQQSQYQPSTTPTSLHLDSTKKIGELVRETVWEIIKADLLTPEKIQELQDEKYCKYTFDINYPFLKKVIIGKPLYEQKNINGYPRYWAKEFVIHGQTYLVCNDWYEKNKSKFIRWVEEIHT